MKSFVKILATVPIFYLVFALGTPAFAQGGADRETYTGTIVSYGSGFNTRTVTSTFTLSINGQTSDQQAQRFLGILQENGQERLLNEIDDENLGYFSVGAQVGQRLNVVRTTEANGNRRIFAVFARWLRFGELRGGYRSTDYPFSVIELSVDPRTGRGEGTFIAAARVRWDRDGNNGQPQVEIENFATFPARLLGVRQRNRNSR